MGRLICTQLSRYQLDAFTDALTVAFQLRHDFRYQDGVVGHISMRLTIAGAYDMEYVVVREFVPASVGMHACLETHEDLRHG